MVNNFTNINKTNNHLSPKLIVHKKITTYDVGVCIRLYNQGTTKTGKGMYYDGIADCFIKTYRAEGMAGLYKGWEPALIRIWPHTVLCLVFWDCPNQ
jgi:solute carrier family 25 protein 34/35